MFTLVFTYIISNLAVNYSYNYKYLQVETPIKTHGSESRGQEEAGLRNERVSYLQVAPL